MSEITITIEELKTGFLVSSGYYSEKVYCTKLSVAKKLVNKLLTDYEKGLD